jgi:PST family polysaccharide transporter
MMGLLAVSETFVAVFLGDKWEGMAALIMILAPIGMIQSIVTTVGSIYTAKGTTGLMFKIGSANAAVTVGSFVAGLPYGVHGVAIAYAIANVIMLYPNLKFAWDQIDLGVLEGIGKLSPFFISSLVMSIAVYFQGTWLSGIGLSQFAILPMQIITGALIYFGILMLLYRNLVLGLLNELRSKKPQMEAF